MATNNTPQRRPPVSTDGQTREFHVADLFTITSGRLLSPRRMDAVYEVINFVTGEAHATHQLVRAAEVVRPELLRQHPFLADIEDPKVTGIDQVVAWAATVADRYGELHVVRALPTGAYVGRDPIAELQELMPAKPISSAMTGAATYVTAARDALLANLADGMTEPEQQRLLDLYTLLVLVKGKHVTLADVHDAWAVARQRERPDHPDLVPFADLTAEVAAYDEPFAAAIRAAAHTLTEET